MALTFPRAMPLGGADSQAFEIARVDYMTPRASGRINSISAGFPLWSMTITLNNGDVEETDEWRAWVPAQRGSSRLFFGTDLTRPFPKAYRQGFTGMTRAGGGAFSGAATSWSVNAERDVITLSGLPANFILGLNDYIGFKWTTGASARRSLVRAVEAVTGSAAGVLAVTVEPALPNLTPGSAVAYLDRPDCLMRLVPGQTSIAEIDTLHSAGGQISAIQDLLA